MAIILTKENRLQSWASWHQDQDINASQAKKLAADALATRVKLTQAALKLKLGRVPPAGEARKHLTEVECPKTGYVWVCWKGEAIAIRTNPVSHVKDCRYYLTWFWKNLGNERN